MLDERLVGLTFTLQDAKSTGAVNFFWHLISLPCRRTS